MKNSARNRLEIIINSIPLKEEIEYEIYSGSFNEYIQVTLLYLSGSKRINFRRTDFLFEDSDRLLTEQEKIELIKEWIESIIFERIVLSRQQG